MLQIKLTFEGITGLTAPFPSQENDSFKLNERVCRFALIHSHTQRRPRRLGYNIVQKVRTVSAFHYSTAAAISRWRNEKGMGSRGRSPSLSGIFFLLRLFLLTTQKKKSRAVWYSSKAVNQTNGLIPAIQSTTKTNPNTFSSVP